MKLIVLIAGIMLILSLTVVSLCIQTPTGPWRVFELLRWLFPCGLPRTQAQQVQQTLHFVWPGGENLRALLGGTRWVKLLGSLRGLSEVHKYSKNSV